MPNPQAKATPRPHPWLLLGVQACRSPGVTRLQTLKRLKINGFLWACLAKTVPKTWLCKSERPTAQAKATPRPHPWLLLGVQACRSPGVTRLKSFKRLNIFLACLIPQQQAPQTATSMASYGVQACLLPGLKRLKSLKSLKPCKSFTPSRKGKSYPKATSMASSGRSSLPFARRCTLETFQTLKHLLGMPLPQPTGTPRPHQWLLMGVQACRLPGLKRLKGLKPLKLCKSFSERPTGAGKSYPKATSMASSGRPSLPFARRYRHAFKPRSQQAPQRLQHPFARP